jgi:predicted transcriptional regulator
MRRNRLEIMVEILDLCRSPRNKTRIMYQANLSWKLVQEYLSELKSRSLLEIHNSPFRYATTEKGLRFVERWKNLDSMLHQS